MPRPRLHPGDVLLPAAFLGLVLIACLMPAHNDTWWHLAYGREMVTRGGFAQTDWFSHTAWGQPFPNHQWLGELVLYAMAAIGGLPLATAFCAALIVGAWSLVWRMTRGPLAERLLVMAAAVMASTLIWSVRPQVFSVALLPLTAFLLARDRLLLVPLLVLVWANLHGGVLLGLILIAGGVVSAAVWNRTRLAPRALCLAGSVAVTAITPLGLRYWPEILASLRRSQVNRIHEWQQTPWPPEQLFFWGLAAALCWLVWRGWRRLSEPDALFVVWALALLPAAVRTLRNVAPFAMIAAPALTRLPARPEGSPPAVARPIARGVIAIGAICVVLIVAAAWSRPVARLGWEPLPEGVPAAIAACPDPLYNRYADGGPIIWFVPGKRVFLDSRQDQYPHALVARADLAEATGDYRELFAEHDIRCAALPASSRVAQALRRDGWHMSFNDSQWTVLIRPDQAAR